MGVGPFYADSDGSTRWLQLGPPVQGEAAARIVYT